MKTITNKQLKEAYVCFASPDLKERLQKKYKGNEIINFAYTDYGGDFFDNVCIEYFIKNHPKNIVWENTIYYGKNAFIFGKVAKEFKAASENYLLGFNMIENYYYAMEQEEELKGFEHFLDDLKKYRGFKIKKNALSYLCENRSGHYPILTTGLDYPEDELIKYCLKNKLIYK